MKKYFLIILIILTNTVFAQQNLMSKITSGRYTHSSGGIYIYDDGTFVLFGYATLVLGNYTIKNNQINFTPTIPKQAFTVLGRRNMHIKKGIQLTFNSDFINDGPTYIKFDNDSLIPIACDNFSGGDAYYTANLDYYPITISLVQNRSSNLYQFNTNIFNLDSNYNEYLLFYQKTIIEQKPFSASLVTEKGEMILESHWGKFVKQINERDEEWEKFLINFKKQQELNKNTAVFYFNDQFKSANGFNQLSEEFSIFDINNYVLDDASNKFIRKDIYRKGKDYSNAVVSEYHEESIILKFENVEVSKKTETNFNEIVIGSNALFVNDKKNNNIKQQEEAVEIQEEPAETNMLEITKKKK
ncbi:hypothetical protein SAMN05444671_1216 [Flavobacterium sp. CF108]|uniref:hypothetical protein n=1 Tax=unclassified Flavobacterium TaxID=196869 RepID=UPI0008B206CF|nr:MULTISPECIES: hypothetical protein [unclassified Flavobacterium]SEO85663.1 hypothetical protein SAMN04487978_3837 [Flavobacterium sp. fv08]SHG69627.1 hypothetical protein SAMN05444671_1216 [Flavobacterium sp. CF108]